MLSKFPRPACPDTAFRRLPDLVAVLFSDSYAEHFCGRDDWRRPLDSPGNAALHVSPASIAFDRHERNAIYVSEAHEQLSRGA